MIKLPDEILLIIFIILFDYDKSPTINLSLVCKKFNHIYNLAIKKYKYFTFKTDKPYKFNKLRSYIGNRKDITNLTISGIRTGGKRKLTTIANLFKNIKYMEIKDCDIKSIKYYEILKPALKNCLYFIIDDTINALFNIDFLPPTLRHLSIRSYMLFNKIIERFEFLEKLVITEFNCHDLILDDKIMSLKRLCLKTLYIEDLPTVNLILTDYLRKNCPNIEKLKIKHCAINEKTEIIPENIKIFRIFFKTLTNMSCIEIFKNPYINDELVEIMFTHMEKLKEVKLNNCENITGNVLSFVTSNITVLEINYCKFVDDEALLELASNVKNSLRHITLQISQVSDEALELFLYNCKKLTYILFCEAVKINRGNFLKYVSEKITYLSIEECSIHVDMLKYIKNKKYYLKHLNIDKIVFPREETEEIITLFIKYLDDSFNFKLSIYTNISSYSNYIDNKIIRKPFLRI
jgi:hypothetical protein